MLAHTRTGSGEPIVLVHGITHRRQIWDEVAALLSTDHEVITVDMLGHGESPNVPWGVDAMSAICNALDDFIDELGLDSPTIAGNSMGGLFSLEMAARGKVSGVVAFAPAVFKREYVNFQVTRLMFIIATNVATLMGPLAKFVFRVKPLRAIAMGWLAYHPTRIEPAHAYADARGMVRALVTALRLSPMKAWEWDGTISREIPVWIVPAQFDRILWKAQRRHVSRLVPHAVAFEQQGVGHVAMYDNPVQVAQIIRDHMAARPAASSAASA